MSKPRLKPNLEALEGQLIDTLRAGLQEWRADRSYPESYSDMQGAVRAIMRRFDIKLRPIDVELEKADATDY